MPCFASGWVVRYSAAVHDFGDAGFVVGAEQCRAVGHNQPVPFVERQFREIGGAHREFVVQRDIAAVVAFDNAGADVRPFHIGTGIDVRNEADDRGRLAARRRRDRTGDIAVRIDLDIVQSEGRHLFEQVVQQGQLFGRRRIGFAFRSLCVSKATYFKNRCSRVIFLSLSY